MSGCYGNDPEDRYFEQMLFDFLESEAWQEEDEIMDEWEQEYYKENVLNEQEYKEDDDEQV